MFFVPVIVFRYSILSYSGLNGDLWSLSVTSFTAVYFIVTLKLMNFIRFYTYIHLIALLVLSFLVYYGYMWISNYVEYSHTYATIVTVHKSPLFYLTVLLCIGMTFVVDMFINAYEFNVNTNPS